MFLIAVDCVEAHFRPHRPCQPLYVLRDADCIASRPLLRSSLVTLTKRRAPYADLAVVLVFVILFNGSFHTYQEYSSNRVLAAFASVLPARAGKHRSALPCAANRPHCSFHQRPTFCGSCGACMCVLPSARSGDPRRHGRGPGGQRAGRGRRGQPQLGQLPACRHPTHRGPCLVCCSRSRAHACALRTCIAVFAFPFVTLRGVLSSSAAIFCVSEIQVHGLKLDRSSLTGESDPQLCTVQDTKAHNDLGASLSHTLVESLTIARVLWALQRRRRWCCWARVWWTAPARVSSFASATAAPVRPPLLCCHFLDRAQSGRCCSRAVGSILRMASTSQTQTTLGMEILFFVKIIVTLAVLSSTLADSVFDCPRPARALR